MSHVALLYFCFLFFTVSHGKRCSGRRELLLVLEGDLYLVPFPVLKPPSTTNDACSEYLSERFSLLVVPSLTSLRANQRSRSSGSGKTQDQSSMTALVVGNPRLPSTITEQWGWNDIPHAEQEATMVAEMLQAKALIGAQVI